MRNPFSIGNQIQNIPKNLEKLNEGNIFVLWNHTQFQNRSTLFKTPPSKWIKIVVLIPCQRHTNEHRQ